MTMGLGISGLDFNTARYVQSVQAMDGLSNAAVSSIYNQSLFGGGYGGYSVGTATLTAAILVKHFRKRMKELEKLIEGAYE